MSIDRDKDKGWHPFIFLAKDVQDNWVAIVMTHSRNFGNIHFDKKYYSLETDDGQEQYIVDGIYLKPEQFRPLKKVGTTSEEGLIFAESRINNLEPKFWKKKNG